jgi:hypothetical protein
MYNTLVFLIFIIIFESHHTKRLVTRRHLVLPSIQNKGVRHVKDTLFCYILKVKKIINMFSIISCFWSWWSLDRWPSSAASLGLVQYLLPWYPNILIFQWPSRSDGKLVTLFFKLLGRCPKKTFERRLFYVVHSFVLCRGSDWMSLGSSTYVGCYLLWGSNRHEIWNRSSVQQDNV